MKNYYLRTVFLLLLLFGTAATAGAYDFVSNGIYYNYSTGASTSSTVYVTYKDTNYNSYSGSVTIPSTVTYNGMTYTVNQIGTSAFRASSNLTNVTIPNSIIAIGGYAFYGCSNLTVIRLPNEVRTILSHAFENCTRLKVVIIGTDISCACTLIGNYAFYGCTALGNSDGSGSFTCMALTPPTVSENTFGELNVQYGLSTMVSAVERYAKLYTPYSATNAYNSSSSRWGYFVNDNHPRWEFYTYPYYYILSGENTAYITHGGETINDYVQTYNNFSNSFVFLPSTANFNGKTYTVNGLYGAFYGCDAYDDVTLPDTYTYIGPSSFEGCTRLNQINIPEGVTYIGYKAFMNTALTDIVIPSTVTEIGHGAFASTGTSPIQSVTCLATTPPYIYEQVNKSGQLNSWSGYKVFNEETHTSAPLYVPKNCKSAYQSAYEWRDFASTYEFTYDFEVNGIYYRINNYNNSYNVEVTFRDGSYNSYSGIVLIPSYVTYNGTTYKVTRIGQYAFYKCNELTGINLPNTITNVDYMAFALCKKLTDITFPNSIKYIGVSAFQGCSALKTVIIGSDITCDLQDIGGYAFYGCTALGNSDHSGSITCMALTPPEIGINAFGPAVSDLVPSSLIQQNAKFYTPYSATDDYRIADGWKLFSNWNNPRWEFYSNLYYYIISGDNTAYITHWGPSVYDPVATYNSSSSRTLPSSVTFNGKTYTVNGTFGAFYGCTNLSNVTIPDTYTYIGLSSFEGCTSLTQINIPEGVSYIGYNAFKNSGLTNVVIPSTVTEVGLGAFATTTGTSPIQTVTCLATTPPYVYQEVNKSGQLNSWSGYNVFNNETYTSAPLYVPAGCKSAYQAAYDWKNFATIIELEPKGYAQFDPSSGTLTFYGDQTPERRSGTTYDLNTGENYPGWYTDGTNADVTQVVFDPSFASARPTSTNHWFAEMYDLTSIEGMQYLNTSEVTNMASMFWECGALPAVDVSGFDTRKVTDMSAMFAECYELTALDVTGWNTSYVTDMSWMFSDCSELTCLDVSHFNTSNVTNMRQLFDGCSGLTSLDVSNFDTSNVTDMSYMFTWCKGLQQLDLSGFNTRKVTNMSCMFNECDNLRTIYVGDGWTTAAVTSSSYMFDVCHSLVGGKGTTYSSSNPKDKTYAHIDGGTSNPGYFSEKSAYKLGDVNGDGNVTIADVTALIDLLLSGDVAYNPSCDVNGDGRITIADVTALIDLLLSGGN